jgi:hypothetical protein
MQQGNVISWEWQEGRARCRARLVLVTDGGDTPLKVVQGRKNDYFLVTPDARVVAALVRVDAG